MINYLQVLCPSTYQFCVLAVFEVSKGQALPLKMRKPIAKGIGVTTGTYVELEEDKQKDLIESTNSEADYGIVVKFTNDGFKLTNLELAGVDNAA